MGFATRYPSDGPTIQVMLLDDQDIILLIKTWHLTRVSIVQISINLAAQPEG
jgi:hypothetical protein